MPSVVSAARPHSTAGSLILLPRAIVVVCQFNVVLFPLLPRYQLPSVAETSLLFSQGVEEDVMWNVVVVRFLNVFREGARGVGEAAVGFRSCGLPLAEAINFQQGSVRLARVSCLRSYAHFFVQVFHVLSLKRFGLPHVRHFVDLSRVQISVIGDYYVATAFEGLPVEFQSLARVDVATRAERPGVRDAVASVPRAHNVSTADGDFRGIVDCFAKLPL